jgi:hypothetical protein
LECEALSLSRYRASAAEDNCVIRLSEITNRRFSIPEPGPRGGNEGFAKISYSRVGDDSRFLKEWTCGGARIDCLKVSESVHGELHGGRFSNKGFATFLGDNDRDGIEQL